MAGHLHLKTFTAFTLFVALFDGGNCDDYKFTPNIFINSVGAVDLFPFGSKYGDKKIGVNEAPTVIKLSRPIKYRKKRFKQMKIHPDGVVDLVADGKPWTPQMAVFGLLYNEVVNGTIWLGQTKDKDLLKKTGDIIQKNFQRCGDEFIPKVLTVITWQNIQTIGQYPQIDEASPDFNYEFASCLGGPDKNYNNELYCECKHLHQYEHDECRYIDIIPNFPAADCWYNLYDFITGSFRYNDPGAFCHCIGHGYSKSVAYCAASFAAIESIYYNTGNFPCDVCQCKASGKPQQECICYTRSDIDPETNFLWDCDSCFTLPGGGDAFYEANPDIACRCFNRSTSLRTVHYSTFCTCIFDWSSADWATLKEGYPDDACNCLFHMYENGDTEFLEGRMAEICECVQSNTQYQHLCRQRRMIESQVLTGNDLSLNARSTFTYKPKFVNTFQMVLASNKYQTYVMFNYKVIENINYNTFVRVGQVDTEGEFTGYNHPYPANLTMFLHLLWNSNVADKGRWIYKVDEKKIKGPGCRRVITGQV